MVAIVARVVWWSFDNSATSSRLLLLLLSHCKLARWWLCFVVLSLAAAVQHAMWTDILWSVMTNDGVFVAVVCCLCHGVFVKSVCVCCATKAAWCVGGTEKIIMKSHMPERSASSCSSNIDYDELSLGEWPGEWHCEAQRFATLFLKQTCHLKNILIGTLVNIVLPNPVDWVRNTCNSFSLARLQVTWNGTKKLMSAFCLFFFAILMAFSCTHRHTQNDLIWRL